MDPQYGDVLKIQAKPSKSAYGKLGLAGMFTAGGTILMVMLALCPIWNAMSLLADFNYVFWAGRRVPMMTIIACVVIIILFVLTSGLFFARAQAASQTEQTTMMIVNIFITLFGLFLMLASLPLTRETELVSSDLLYNCAYSEQTHRLYEYSQVLQNIRATPACAKKLSVEDCAGYQASPPYTDFLRSMEKEFKCAGFCYTAPKAANSSKLLGIKESVKQRHAALTQVTDATDTAEAGFQAAQTDLHAAATYPPTLFSDANWQASCGGMAARNMKNVAGDVGYQTFYQGLYLIIIAVTTGFLKLFGLCMRKG